MASFTTIHFTDLLLGEVQMSDVMGHSRVFLNLSPHGDFGDEFPSHAVSKGCDRLRAIQLDLFESRDDVTEFAWCGAKYRVTTGTTKRLNDVVVRIRDYASQITYTTVGMAESHEVSNLSEYVSIKKRAFLNGHLNSWFSSRRILRRLMYKLHDLGIVWVGDVIQLTEEQIRHMTGASTKAIAALKDELAHIGLRLGMKVTNWKRPKERTSEPREW